MSPSVGPFRIAAAILLAVLLLLVITVAIPFYFESPSIQYKFGIEKASLRIGKVLGLGAGLLILLQFPLAGRLKLLDRIFSLPLLMRQHRRHAWIIVSAVLVHPLCILLPEGKLTVPLEMRYWPEWIGVGLLVAVLAQFASSWWRKRSLLAFHIWLPVHRTVSFLIAVLLIIHVRYVSETFSNTGPPRLGLLTMAAVTVLIWLWVRTGWLRASRYPYRVATVAPAGADCTRVELTPLGKNRIAYLPGQFVFVAFRSAQVSREPHAFTLSSTPSRPETLQLTIRACGDWTGTLARLTIGDQAVIRGPFGRFSHLFTPPRRELILIAGGIGITPMLSMLRFMSDRGDDRTITLVWSNRHRDDMVYADELDDLECKLTGLRRVPIFMRTAGSVEHPGRLNRVSLDRILGQCGPNAAIFLCGPPLMMRQVKSALIGLGFSSRFIFTEAFDL
jgi:predicted ferric reductase